MPSEEVDDCLSVEAELASRTSELAESQHVARLGSWEWDIPTNSVSWSDELYRIYGLVPQEFGATFEAYMARVHPDDRGPVQRAIETACAKAATFSFEERIIQPDGTIRILQSRGTAVVDEAGQVIKLRGLCQDVTEQKQIEQALRESEERFASAFVYAGIGMAMVDLSGGLFKVNQALCDFLGYSADELMALTFQEITHPDDLDADLENVRSLLAGEARFYSMEKRYIHKQGPVLWASLHVSLIRDQGGRPLYLISQVQDITERKQAKIERDRFFTMSLDMLIIAGFDGYFKRLNPAFLEALGYTESELKARPSLEFVHPEDRAAILAARDKLFTGNMVGLENRYRSKDGSWRWLEWKSVGAVEEGVVYAAARDVTERKKAEEALRQAHDELELRVAERTAELEVSSQQMYAAKQQAELANAAKSEFLSRMSHELRTPLNAILGFGQMLDMHNETLSSRQKEDVSHILKAGKHLLDLVNEVLDIERIHAPDSALSFESVSLSEVAREALDMLQPMAVTANITIPRQLEAASELFVLADRQRVLQILLNLLVNAIKFNKPDGFVTMFARAEPEGRVSVHVTDTGYGIEEEDMTKLFVPFLRMNAERLGVAGTGLGLVLCQRLAQAMEGGLHVESKPGQGSTFSLELPLAQPPASAEANPPSAIEIDKYITTTTLMTRATILLIEDNISNFELIEAVLEGHTDARLISAIQGGLGVELAIQQRPDLILLDLQLPDIMGDEVLRRLQANPETKDIPVIVLSADATPSQITSLMAQGARQYLTKPIDLKLFLQAVKEAIPT